MGKGSEMSLNHVYLKHVFSRENVICFHMTRTFFLYVLEQKIT